MSSKYYWREEVKIILLKPRGKKRKSAAKRREWNSKYGFFGASVKAYSTMMAADLVPVTTPMSPPSGIISYLNYKS